MQKFYSIAFVIYTIGLGLLIVLLPFAFFLSGVEGDDRNLELNFLLLPFAATTIIALMLFKNTAKASSVWRFFLFYLSVGLVLISVFYEFYWFYDMFFICKCFTTGDNIASLIMFLFSFITIAVLIGFFKNRF